MASLYVLSSKNSLTIRRTIVSPGLKYQQQTYLVPRNSTPPFLKSVRLLIYFAFSSIHSFQRCYHLSTDASSPAANVSNSGHSLPSVRRPTLRRWSSSITTRRMAQSSKLTQKICSPQPFIRTTLTRSELQSELLSPLKALTRSWLISKNMVGSYICKFFV